MTKKSRFRNSQSNNDVISPEVLDDLVFPTMITTIEDDENGNVNIINAYYNDEKNRKILGKIDLGSKYF